MLQEVSSNASDFGDAKAQPAKKALLEVAELQDKLMGKGLFRRFLEDRMAVESETEMACSSPAFVAAASLLIRLRSLLRNGIDHGTRGRIVRLFGLEACLTS